MSHVPRQDAQTLRHAAGLVLRYGMTPALVRRRLRAELVAARAVLRRLASRRRLPDDAADLEALGAIFHRTSQF